jgi:iron complex outermembrane receptor protein
MTVPNVTGLTADERANNIWYQNLSNHLVTGRGNTFFGKSKLSTRVSYQNNHRMLHTIDATAVDMVMSNLSFDIKYHFPSQGDAAYLAGIQGAFKENENGEASNRVLPDHTSNDIALYTLIQYPFSEKLHFQAGVRGDARTIDIPEQEASGHSHDEEANEEEEEEHLEAFEEAYQNFSGSAGLTYRMNPKLLFRANLSSGYRTPNTAELSQEGIHGIRYERGNRALNSQRNYEADLNVHYHCCHLMFDAALFYNQIDDFIFLEATGSTVEEEGATYPLYIYGQGNATIQGAEIGIESNPTTWLNAKATYATLRGKLANGGNLPFIPHDKLRLFIRAEKKQIGVLKKPYIRISGLYAFGQEHPSRFETPTGEYMVLDLTTATTLKAGTQSLKLGISITNLLDTSYIDHLSTLKPLGYNAMGRNFQLWLNVPLSY